jgi:DNA mismatch repair ATPase MutS
MGFLTAEQDMNRKEPDLGSEVIGAAIASKKRRITFLYRLVPGVAESSFGLNIAQLAGLPRSVVDKASVVAAEFEADGDACREEDEFRLVSNALCGDNDAVALAGILRLR